MLLLHGVLGAIRKLLLFYSIYYGDINLDGLFGLRLIEGQLQLLTQQSTATISRLWSADSTYFLREVDLLKFNASKFADTAYSTLVHSNPGENFIKLKKLVSKPWLVHFSRRFIDPTLRWSTTSQQKPFNEVESDKCMAELFDKCHISSECKDRMLKTKGLKGYSLLHQLLYIGASLQAGRSCYSEVEDYIKGALGYSTGIDGFILEWCTNSYYDALDLIPPGQNASAVPIDKRDLFLEHQFVCGNLGFMDFARRSWLQAILSWQREQGCFGYGTETLPPQRSLKELKLLKGGCEAHMTAVAAGALTVYLRFLLEPLNSASRAVAQKNPDLVVPEVVAFVPHVVRWILGLMICLSVAVALYWFVLRQKRIAKKHAHQV